MTNLVLGHESWVNSTKPSRVTVPDRVRHPVVKIVFQEMQTQGVTYAELEHRSGVLTSTIKSWRKEKSPNLFTLEAALGAVGWRFIAVPDPELLTPDARDALAALIPLFRSEQGALAAAIATATARPMLERDQIASLAAQRGRFIQPMEIAA